MKVYLNKEYKCVKVEDNTFVANDSSNYIRYYFVTNANGDVIDKMDDTSVIYRNTEPSYVTVAFRRADGNVIQHLMASPKTDVTGNSFFEYEITDTDGVLYKKGALEISAQFIEATLSEAGGVKKVISQKVKAIAINTAHVLDNIGEEAEEYYSQYEQANNDAHAVLQAQITTNFNNIGTLQELTTDAKDDLVKAINEVDAHADANKSAIGNLSTLTTDEKTTIVGAINEVDQHANTAQQTADDATVLANTGISKAEQAQATANGAVATANEAKAIAQGSQRAIGFATLQAAITALNGYSNTQLKVGDNVYIVETGVPDLWVAAVEQNSVAYNYTTNDAFNDDLVENTLVQVGYYKFAYLESDGKPCTVAWQNMVVAASDWVASTEFEDFAYEAKIILSDFVNFSSIPQVVFGLTEATSGNYAPICKAGDKGVYIYSKVNTAITLPTVVTFAPNVHGASMQGGGYTNKGKWVASTTYAIDDLVYTDNGQFVCIEGITSTTSPEQDTQHWQATFVANVPVKSVNGQTGAVTIEVPTKTSDLTNDSNFAKTTEANTWTGVQTFSNADGIKTDRVHNLDNNDAWYNFDGSNNRFGSPSRPTIIRTSEARPRVQVPSGETTVTKEIALLEDIANALYPVGSIYMSVNNTNPSTFFGGTWEAWGAGKVPVGVDTSDTNFSTVEQTGGEKQHTLTIAEMPAHNHTIPCTPTANDGSEPTYQAAQVNAEATGYHNSIVAVSSGGGSPHNNLQPYITCYMWKRTA